jgi:hypothetical protein
LIAAWCGITVASARLYKSGKRKPSRTVLRMFTLHREERVLGTGWHGWRVRDGVIVDPEGNSTSASQLRAYALIVQFAAELAKRDPVEYERYRTLLHRA